MGNNKKLNDGCLKIFQLLILLYEDKADYDSVVNIFKDEIDEPSINTIQVNLNKYFNTLKVFGIKIKKENNKFKLLSSLYSMKFSLDDLRAISLLTSSIHNFPDLDLTQDVSNFIQSLEARMNNDDKNKLDALNQNLTTDNSFYYSDFREQIKQCEEICIENHEITVTYNLNGGTGTIPSRTGRKGFELTVANPNELNIIGPNNRPFDHWETRTTDNETMGEYHSGQETTVWNNMTLYAVWA